MRKAQKGLEKYFIEKNITADSSYCKQKYNDLDGLSNEIQDYMLKNAKMTSPANGSDFSTVIARIASEKKRFPRTHNQLLTVKA